MEQFQDLRAGDREGLKECAKWLKEECGDVPSRFPPASVVRFKGNELHEFAVVGYCRIDGQPTIKIADLADMARLAGSDYDLIPKECKNVCPKHELPNVMCLYNQNGEAFTEMFR